MDQLVRDGVVLFGVLALLVGAVALALWLWERRSAAVQKATAEANATDEEDTQVGDDYGQVKRSVDKNDAQDAQLAVSQQAAQAVANKRQDSILKEPDDAVDADLRRRGLIK